MMTLAMLYPWLKALHVAAALMFVGGVSAGALCLSAAPHAAGAQALAAVLERWDRYVTTPAMLLVWGLGLGLATMGHWFDSGRWLIVKLVLVVLLSGLHGVQSGRLSALRRGAAARPWRAAPAVVVLVAGIAMLAVVKPF
ncbi:CopD family protein [Burkholderia sp. 22PA0099]|uniref:CopD family protein n=1 Tax=Burkholderia sp. 22PA0099 TaxID=3237372 RepID=UPI0039C0B775